MAAALGALLAGAAARSVEPVDGAAAVVAVVEVGALALRRVAPVACVAVVFGVALGHWLLAVTGAAGGAATGLVVDGWTVQVGDVAVPLALYAVAAHGPRWARWAALALALLGAVLVTAPLALPVGSLGRAGLGGVALVLVLLVAVVAVAWTAGAWRRTRLENLAALRDRAARAETEHEQQAVIAAATERARIARELHDIVAHSLSVMIAQADGGRYAAAASPASAVAALATVASTGRAALADMRRLLGVLRDDGDAGGALAPQPDAGSVPALVEAVRASGLPVALVTTGVPRPLSPGAGLAVYRVVQEGLTNVLKHGGPGARAQVRLHWSPASVEVWVEDDGRGAAAGGGGGGGGGGPAGPGAGQGLPGMAERMALYGGGVQAGPRAEGGFAVRALLPVPGSGLPVVS